jgi:CheY-like chemotaxis protein
MNIKTSGPSRQITWPASPRILLVEADDDHAAAVTHALESAGYPIERARTAGEGLARLEHESFGLVLAHYGLPDRSGIEMLTDAGRRGLLGSARALLFSGRGDLESGGYTLLKKPLDLSDLVKQVQAMLGSSVGPGPERRAAPRRKCQVEIALYVNPPWPSSLKARANMDRVLARAAPGAVQTTVYDMGKDPERAVEDRVIFSPTLVKVWPEPRLWILGDLTDPRPLVEMLEACGVTLVPPPAASR